jgi:transposase-like protein
VRHAPGDWWSADETYVKVASKWTYLCRAVDQRGQVIDVPPSERRDLAAAYQRALNELIPSALAAFCEGGLPRPR